MRNIIGLANTDLNMEPFSAIAESTDVVFIEDNNDYVAVVDDHLTYLDESIPQKNESTADGPYLQIQTPSPYKLADGDYATQFYLGAISVVGLFILFRMMQKSRA
jgi:hypothetical protein